MVYVLKNRFSKLKLGLADFQPCYQMGVLVHAGQSLGKEGKPLVSTLVWLLRLQGQDRAY